MPKQNNQAQQAQALLDEFKAANAKAKAFLSDLDKKIAAADLKYAQHLVQNDINIMKAAKTVLEGEGK
ncbi:MAG: hypothetical protein PHS62_00760 [Patescibacteria group bacterium]|nr:hypothetical protein [Patescibacteria group bacterium]